MNALKEKINQIRNLKALGCMPILKFGILNDVPNVGGKYYWSSRISVDFMLNVIDNMVPELRKIKKEDVVFSPAEFENVFSTTMEIKRLFGIDIAKYFLDCAIDSKIKVSSCSDAIKEVFKPEYKLDPRRAIEYLCYEFPEQGILELSGGWHSTLTEYKDYLNMEYQIYGKEKEKYPNYLRTVHDITQMKFRVVEDVIMERNFGVEAQKYKDLALSGDYYTIMLPERPADLVEEGRRLCHCVASYAKRVASGETMIVFCRRNSDIENPYCTIEVRNGCVVQARCLQNRRPDDDTLKFIQDWAEKKNLNYRIL